MTATHKTADTDCSHANTDINQPVELTAAIVDDVIVDYLVK